MDKFKKIDKEFTLSDSSLNSYSYRLLTSGYLMDEFKKNPIGYYMHGTTKESPREAGVLVKWDDLRVVGDVVFGKPCINLMHPRGQRTVNEVESGFLNAASFGNMVVLEISDDPADYLEGQTGLSASKWYNRECSLVDIGGNYNATVSNDLFDEFDTPLNLADFNTQNFKMEKIILTTAQLASFTNLKADAKQVDFDVAFADLLERAGKTNVLVQDLTNAKNEISRVVTELGTLKSTTISKEVKDLVDAGITNKKITVEAGNKLSVSFAKNPAGLKDLMDSLQPITGVVAQIDKGAKNVANLVALTYDELDESGKLADLKAADPISFYEKFEGKFGKKHSADK